MTRQHQVQAEVQFPGRADSSPAGASCRDCFIRDVYCYKAGSLPSFFPLGDRGPCPQERTAVVFVFLHYFLGRKPYVGDTDGNTTRFRGVNGARGLTHTWGSTNEAGYVPVISWFCDRTISCVLPRSYSLKTKDPLSPVGGKFRLGKRW